MCRSHHGNILVYYCSTAVSIVVFPLYRAELKDCSHSVEVFIKLLALTTIERT